MVRINVAAHGEEKAGKKKVGQEERKQSTDFRLRTALLRSFRGQHGEKNGLHEGSAQGNSDLGKANSHFHPTQWDQAAPLR